MVRRRTWIKKRWAVGRDKRQRQRICIKYLTLLLFKTHTVSFVMHHIDLYILIERTCSVRRSLWFNVPDFYNSS